MSNLAIQPKQLADLVHGLGVYAQDVSIKHLCDDTRKLRDGDTFLCLPRVKDKEATMQEAIAKGANAVIMVGVKDKPLAVPCACWPDMQAAGAMLRRWFETEAAELPCVGITGTDGKTSTAWMLREALALHKGSAWSCGTLGWVKARDDIQDLGNTTPSLMTLHRMYALACREGVGALVLEVSSHGIAQDRIAGLPFTAAVWTTMGQDHLEDHGGFAPYLALKSGYVKRVLHDGGKVVANADYAYIRDALDDVRERVFWYGSQAGKAVDLRWQYDVQGIHFSRAGESVTLRHMPLADFHAENLAAIALLMTVAFDVPLSAWAAWDGHISTPMGRLEPVNDEYTVFLDYAHTAEGLKRCLQSARKLAQKRLLLVFGCGGDRDKGKRPAMGAVAARYADRCWLTSDNPRSESQQAIAEDVLRGVHEDREKLSVCHDREAAITEAVSSLESGDILVIAGKGHETSMEIGGIKHPWSDKAVALQAISKVATCA